MPFEQKKTKKEASLPYQRSGSGFPLVLIHGYLGASLQWQELRRNFEAEFDVIALDLPGFGEASHLQGCATIQGMAYRIIETLNQLKIDQFHLLGHSMGGMIVQEIAAQINNRVKKLVLYGTGPLGLMPNRFESIEVSMNRLQDQGVLATVKKIAPTWFCEKSAAQDYPLVERLGQCANFKAALLALEAMAQWDGRRALARLGMPTLIIWGEKDRSYRWPQIQHLWRDLADTKVAIIQGASHAAHLEKPELFSLLLDEFLSN